MCKQTQMLYGFNEHEGLQLLQLIWSSWNVPEETLIHIILALLCQAGDKTLIDRP